MVRVAAPFITPDGLVIAIALPEYAIAIELIGPRETVARAGEMASGRVLSLRALWRTAVLSASGWTVISIPLSSIVASRGLPLNALVTLDVITKALPAHFRHTRKS